MLVLSRRVNKRGERVIVLQVPAGMPAHEIRVELVECDYPAARIGFTAPPEVKIFREELLVEGRLPC